MRIIVGLIIVVCLLPGVAAADRALDAGVIEFEQDQSVLIQTHDDRDLIYLVDRPKVDRKLPILMLIDGSGCVGQSRPDIGDFYRPVAIRTSLQPYARLRVEKPGVGHADDWPQESCSEDFLKHYTVDKRVEDHLRVLQHLRASADWWNGEVLIFGWSDGGDIGTRLSAYYPDVMRAVLGGMGGGIPMAQHFEEDWICSDAAQVGDHEGCVASLRKEFQRMADNPTWKRTWSGEDNSWRVWASRLFSTTTALLVDNHTPVLIVHGRRILIHFLFAALANLSRNLPPQVMMHSNTGKWSV